MRVDSITLEIVLVEDAIIVEIKATAFVSDRKIYLPFKLESQLVQLIAQTLVINTGASPRLPPRLRVSASIS